MGLKSPNLNLDQQTESRDRYLIPLKKEPRKLADIECEYILRTLLYFKVNREITATTLGICPRTLRNKLNLYRQDGYRVIDSESTYRGKMVEIKWR